MVGFTIVAGAMISLVVGWVASEYLFGKSSTAGYHGTRGKFRTKGRGTELKLMKLLFTAAAGLLLAGTVAGILASLGPLGAIGVAFVLVFVFLHLDIDHWRFL